MSEAAIARHLAYYVVNEAATARNLAYYVVNEAAIAYFNSVVTRHKHSSKACSCEGAKRAEHFFTELWRARTQKIPIHNACKVLSILNHIRLQRLQNQTLASNRYRTFRFPRYDFVHICSSFIIWKRFDTRAIISECMLIATCDPSSRLHNTILPWLQLSGGMTPTYLS